MSFICENPDCSENKKELNFHKVIYKWSSELGRFASDLEFCPVCKKLMHNSNHDVPLSEKHIEISKFQSLNREQKTAALKKRSHEHFEKNIKESKENLMGRAMGEMRKKAGQ